MTTDKGKLTERYLWVDYARFLCLFMVIFFHVPVTLPLYPRWSLFLLQLPLFITISGLLFSFEKYDSFGKFLKHRSKQLLIPYFGFTLIFYSLWLISRVVFKMGDMSIPLWKPVFETFYGSPILICPPFWFIVCLFSIQMLFYLLFHKVKNRLITVAILFTITFIPIVVNIKEAPWMLASALIFIPFYGLGVCFKKEVFNIMKSPLRFVVGAVCLILHFIILPYWVLDISNHYISHFIRIINGLLIIFPFFVLSKLISDALGSRWFVNTIAANGVTVLACHMYVIAVILRLFGLTEESMAERYGLKFLLAVSVMVLMIIPVLLVDKYMPFLLGKKKSVKKKSIN